MQDNSIPHVGNTFGIAAPAILIALSCVVAHAMDFLEKRECTIIVGSNRAPVHTTCVVSGGMQGGSIDVSIRTPDGKKYPLEGPTDGVDGRRYLLQGRPAHIRDSSESDSSCYARDDRKLAICLGDKID